MGNYNYNQNYQGRGDNRTRTPYRQEYQQGQRPQKKRSGCKCGLTKDRNEWISGWKKSSTHGLISFIAGRATKGGKQNHVTKNERWEYWLAKVKFGSDSKPELVGCLYDLDKRRLHFKEMNLIANPNRNYFGKHISKR